jgi:hypothetical protein
MAEENVIENELATPEVEISDVERRARNVGWVPKDEFRGDPNKHVSAEEFLQRSDSLMPLMRRDNDKLHKRVNDLEGILKETRDAQKELLEFTSKAEQRAYDKAKAELQAKAEAAAANADQAGVRQAMHEMDSLTQPFKPTAPPPPKPNADPVIQDWIAREHWYRTSEALKGYAIEEFGEIERNHPGMTVEDMLAETKKRTMERFPEKFGINRNRERPASVATPTGGNGAAPKRNEHGFANLPQAAKDSFKRWKKQIPDLTEEEFASNYDWES